MSHFARVDKSTNKVTDVVVATQAWVYEQTDSEDWFQTSYNQSDGKPFAAVGSTYDRENNLFIPVQPIESTTGCLLYTSPSPRDRQKSRMPSSA